MKKDFQNWHALKSKIDDDDKNLLYVTREVWWCSLGANVGVEADGKDDLFQRPVIIFRKFNRDMFWGLPMTAREKDKKPYFFPISLHGQAQTVILSQLRILSSKRLIRHLGKLGVGQFRMLNEAMENYIKQTDPLRGPPVPNGNK